MTKLEHQMLKNQIAIMQALVHLTARTDLAASILFNGIMHSQEMILEDHEATQQEIEDQIGLQAQFKQEQGLPNL